MKKIEVFLRQCFYSPNTALSNRKRPEWFDKIKVFENLKRTIDPTIANLNIIYDEHYGSLEETFLSKEENIQIINCGNEAGSFLKTIEIVEISGFDDDTIIYFLEDDYLHRENWCNILLEAFTLPIQYASLYDHLDKYTDYPDLVSKIFCTSSVHWRTTPSTCNTYATPMRQLKEDMYIHKHFSAASSDGISMDHAKFVHLGSMGRTLVTPMPGYSTHCDLLHSPTIDWEKYI
jgi:hypothetical protein